MIKKIIILVSNLTAVAMIVTLAPIIALTAVAMDVKRVSQWWEDSIWLEIYDRFR